MPDDACNIARELLRHQLDRLRALLIELNGGEPWPSDHLAQYDVEVIFGHAKTIEASLDEITRIVAMTKD